jgi:predicted MFS family arabinose efflux permease
VGKATVAAAIAALAALIGWRAAGAAYGAIGLAAAAGIALVLGRMAVGAAERDPAAAPRGAGWGIRDRRGFAALSAIGMIDNATRTGFLTFVGFVLIAKGSTVAGVGMALSLVFAGGAAGKFVCGLIADRVGVIRTVVLTELATALAILTVVASPLPVAFAALAPLGVALNGTSSVLYGTVADLVDSERRSRAYGLYYTLSIGASALAPSIFGLVSDAVGPATTLVAVSLVVLATIPLALVLRSAVGAPAPAAG